MTSGLPSDELPQRCQVSKSLLEELRQMGLLEFGSVIDGDTVRKILGVEYPEYGTKKDFDEIALSELKAIDYVRNVLLGEGKYIASNNGGYRILLPSENQGQIESYIGQADRKLRRAQKLSRNTPSINKYDKDADRSASIAMKLLSARGMYRNKPENAHINRTEKHQSTKHPQY